MKLEVIPGGRYALEAAALQAIWLGSREESEIALRRLTKSANSPIRLVTCATDEPRVPAPENEQSS